MRKAAMAIAIGTVVVSACGGGGGGTTTASTNPTSTSVGTNTTTTGGSSTTTTTPTSSSGSLPSTGLAASYAKTVWFDDFSQDPSGTPNTSLWAMETGNGAEYGNPGWGNNEAEYYLPSNAAVGNGDLVITGKADNSQTGYSFTSAKVTSRKAIDLSQPGFLEVKAKLPTGTGSWPAIWLLPGQSPGQSFPPTTAQLATQPTWPAGGEIDMVEWLSRYFGTQNSVIQSTFHLPSGVSSPAYTDAYQYVKATLSTPIDTSFHLYQLAWTATQIQFAVDNTVLTTCSKSTLVCTPADPSSPLLPASAFWPYGGIYQTYYLIMNLAVGGNLGAPNGNNSALPANYSQTMDVAYVRYMTP